MRIEIDERIAVDVIDRENFGCSTIRVAGEATDENPARLVLLRRHADMADETPAADARIDVERGADEVARILAGVDLQATTDLTSVIQDAHNALQSSGTYYSILVAIVATSHVVAAGIGNVSVHLWASGAAQEMLRSTTIVVGSKRILSSALGLGFDPERIQAINRSLGSGDRIILGVDAEMSLLQPISSEGSPTDVLRRIVEEASFERSVIVGVIAAA